MKRTIVILLITMLCACVVTTPPEAKISSRDRDKKSRDSKADSKSADNNSADNKSADNKSADNKSADDQWVGHSVDELVVAVGEPSNVYTLVGGGRTFEYLQPNKTTISTQPSLSAEDERARRIRAKRKNLASDQYQNCKTLRVLFKISALDIIESWSIKGEKCK